MFAEQLDTKVGQSEENQSGPRLRYDSVLAPFLSGAAMAIVCFIPMTWQRFDGCAVAKIPIFNSPE